MSDIDDKLQEVFLSKKYMQASVDPTLYEAIHQVFKEAGYIQIPQEVRDTWKEYDTILRGTTMTGQEWYKRFEKNIEEWRQGALAVAYSSVQEAAKKAAGIS